jgi:hypothetical protein
MYDYAAFDRRAEKEQHRGEIKFLKWFSLMRHDAPTFWLFAFLLGICVGSAITIFFGNVLCKTDTRPFLVDAP